jgi:fatty-acyl-CoA synthase
LPPLSYSRGAEAPLIQKTIAQALADTAARFPDREALVVCHQNIRLTWSELDREATRVARGLAGLGLSPGDRAGIWASNCVEWILMQHAAARSGVVLVNVNPAYRSHELRYVLQKSRIRALFLRESDARADYRAILADSRNDSLSGESLPLEHVVWLGDPSWDAMLSGGRDFPRDTATTHDVANIQYTSGTTGSPKGVLLTHHNLLNDGKAISLALRATEQDRICAPVPLYHCFGSVIGSMVSVVSGAALILPSAQFDALATLEAVHRERATALYGVPTMFIAELVHPDFDQFDLTSLRTGVMAGAPCPIEVMRTVAERMHCPEMTIAYGQTESSPVITMSRVDDPLELRVTTVGAALANTEVQIADPETGQRVPIGEQGELCTRGYLVMKGYDDDPEATAAVIDSEGWLTPAISPPCAPTAISVSAAAPRTPSFAAERTSTRAKSKTSCTPTPKSPTSTSSASPTPAWAKPSLRGCSSSPAKPPPPKKSRPSAKAKIAYFKIPQYVRFVDGFPMTVTKKIQKFLMREQEIRERGLEQIAGQATA